MKRLVSHESWASIIGMLYLGMIVNLLLLIACLPLIVLLVTTDPMLSWPLLALTAPLCAPGIAAAFRAFREHHDGGLSPIRAFGAGLRDTWRRALLVGVAVVATLAVVLVDVRMLSAASAAVFVVPLLGVLAVLAAAIGTLTLVAIAESPGARVQDAVRASAVLGLRRWYLTGVSLIALIVQAGVFAAAPAIGLGITASAILFFVWTNSRFTLRPVLDLDEAVAA